MIGELITSPLIQPEPISSSPLLQPEPISSSPLLQPEPISSSPLLQPEPNSSSPLLQPEPNSSSPLLQHEPMSSPLLQHGTFSVFQDLKYEDQGSSDHLNPHWGLVREKKFALIAFSFDPF